MASDAAFFGDGASLIQTTIELTHLKRECSIEEFYEIRNTLLWLQSFQDVNKVALQFPDDMLCDSATVVSQLKESRSDLNFIVLADTSYSSCCADLIAAQHYRADALIHYGISCLSPPPDFPVLWVFGRSQISVKDCCCKLQVLSQSISEEQRHLVLMYSVEYDYISKELFDSLMKFVPRVQLSYLATNLPTKLKLTDQSETLANVNGRIWKLANSLKISDYDVLYIGVEGQTLTNLMMTMNSSKFYTYNPISQVARLESINVNRNLMKRFYMVEKAKDARIVGIVVGTMGVNNYLEIHNRLKELIKKSGKKSYSFVVGKLNPAKLGNFMEIDVFVLVSCCENSLIDSSEFHRPVVTPYEMELACNTHREWTGDYATDFATLLPGGAMHEPIPDVIDYVTDVSLVSGSMRQIGIPSEPPNAGSQVAVREKNRQLVYLAPGASMSAGEYLASRSWLGLEQELGQTPVTKVKKGQAGIASSYENEPK